MTAMHGTPPHSNIRGLSSYLYYAAIPLGVTLLIASTTYVLLLATPQSSRLDLMHHPDTQKNHLRSSVTDHFLPSSALSHGTDEFLTPFFKPANTQEDKYLLPPIWTDGFFSPLETDSFFKQLQERQPLMWFDPVFDLTQDEDSVSLTTSIPDIPLKYINIEVIDGTVLHIHGEKNTPNSLVSFDKRFALGHRLEETNIKATLTKSGDLIVSAPKVGFGKKSEVRKIPVLEEL